ncbi:hypothetical protein [Pseudomonas sp. NPDC089569]|uniref:hypothetical protein n=1 Tax=Pseudomonas sp. NPDC089569 TaxID=3390722 RepID=UPI003D039D7D
MSRLSIYSKSTPHIREALTKAKELNLTGVLSQVQFPSSKSALGFVFGCAGFADETPIRTSTITLITNDVICTESGSQYILADCLDSKATQDKEMIRQELIEHQLALDECVNGGTPGLSNVTHFPTSKR